MTETAPEAPLPDPPADVTSVRINTIVGLRPQDSGPTNVGLGFDIGAAFTVSLTLIPDAADFLASELRTAAQLAREQSSPIATPIKKIIIPGR